MTLTRRGFFGAIGGGALGAAATTARAGESLRVPRPQAPRAHTLFRAEQFRLDSAIMGRAYDLSVALPLNGVRAGVRYPALFVLDGVLIFGMAAETARLLTLGGEVHDIIVIGVGCPWDEFEDGYVRRRVHEFSPTTAWRFDDPFGITVKRLIDSWGISPAEALGGAPDFLRCLRDEMLPAVEGRYPIDRTTSGLFGDSAGGAFVLYALLSDQAPFRRYICGSPATAYNDGYLFELEQRYAATHDDLDATLFLAAGEEEMSNAYLESGGIVSGVARFSGLFARRAYPSLSVTSHIFAGEGHVSALPSILTRGVRTLWTTGRRYGELP